MNKVSGATLGNAGFTGFGNAGNTSAADDAGFLSAATQPVSTLFGAGGAFTFEAMIKVSNTAGNQQIFSMDNDPDSITKRPFQFRIDSGSLKFLNIANSSTLTATIPVAGDDAFAASNWYHVAVAYNGTENTVDNLKLYWTRVDASRTQANQIGSFNMTSDLGGIDALYGVGNDGRATGAQNKNLKGLIDEVRISGVARGAQEMLFIPEPSSSLLVSSLGLLALLRRRRQA